MHTPSPEVDNCLSTLMMAPGSAPGLLCVLVLGLLRCGDTKFHDECDYSANYKCGDVCDRRYYDCQCGEAALRGAARGRAYH